MRLSVLKFCKTAALPATLPKVRTSNLFRICGSVAIAQILLALYIEEFALPTPDLVYDFHMKYSQGFIDYAYGNKYGAGVFRRHVGDRQTDKELGQIPESSQKCNLFFDKLTL